MSLLQQGSTASYGGSTTLQQIGFLAALKARSGEVRCFRDDAEQTGGDTKKYMALMRQGAAADYYVSSCSAITEAGALYAVDASSTRIAGWLNAGKLIVVAGTNKLVKDDAEAQERTHKYQFPLESARCRVDYKGVPGSSVNNEVCIRRAYPDMPRVTVVLVEQALGF